MNPNSISLLLPLLLSLSSSFLPPAASLCKPRSSPYDLLANSYIQPYSKSPPSPSPKLSPRPLALTPEPSPAPSSSSLDATVRNAINSLRTGFLGDSVKAICDKTDHPAVCMSSIESATDDLSALGTDVFSILKVVIKSAVDHTNVALQKANGLADQSNANASTKSLLSACTDGYNDALQDLSDAVKALERNDRGALSSDLSALFSDYETCSDAFSEAQMTSPMKDDETLLTQIASNCLAIGDLIN